MLKIIKLGNLIHENIEPFYIDENEKKVWNIPNNVDELKVAAVETVNWVTGQKIKESLGNTQVQLSTSNSKGIILLAKVLSSLNPELAGLNELEKDSFSKMVSLAEKGYADSNLLNDSLSNVDEFLEKASAKIVSINEAISIEEIIDILNSEF